MVKLACQGLVWRVRAQDAARLRDWLMRYFPIVPGRSDLRVLQQSANRFVVAADGLVLKEAGPRPKRSRLAFGVRPPVAWLLSRRSLALLACGIPTHEPVAWSVKRVGGLRVRDYLVTREIVGTESLIPRLDRERANRERREETLTQLGRLTAALHRHRFGNRDMRGANILCSREGPLRLWVTDLEGLRRFPWLPRRIAEGDLGPIALSLRSHGWLTDPSDEAAFFAAYNAEAPPRLRRTAFPD